MTAQRALAVLLTLLLFALVIFGLAAVFALFGHRNWGYVVGALACAVMTYAGINSLRGEGGLGPGGAGRGDKERAARPGPKNAKPKNAEPGGGRRGTAAGGRSATRKAGTPKGEGSKKKGSAGAGADRPGQTGRG